MKLATAARRRAAEGPGRAGRRPRDRQEIGRARLPGARRPPRPARLHPGQRRSGKPPIGWCFRTRRSPFLQGWAIVENTSEDDWSGVNLSLISGRPISFTMDLYEPLFVARPEVELEIYASLRPQVYGQDLARSIEDFASSEKRLQSARTEGEGVRNCGGTTARAARPCMPQLDGATLATPVRRAMDRGVLVRSVRRGGPSRQRGRTVPVCHRHARSSCRGSNRPCCRSSTREVEGAKLSIYNAGVHAKHPLYGLRFRTHGPLPDAGPDHRLRRRRLRRRRQDRGHRRPAASG